MQTGMTKLIYSDSYGTDVDVGMRLIEDPAQLNKSAATIFDCEYSDLTPDKDHVGIHLVALGDFEHYGCFFAGAPVQTINGQKAIEDVKVGDMVLTHKNRYRPVITIFEDAYNGDRISLDVVGLPDLITCTSNHPFRVVRRDGLSPTARFYLREDGKLADELEQRVINAEKVAASDIHPGDYLITGTEIDTTGIDTISDEYDPYVLGFYVAVGCLVKEYRDIATKGEYKTILLTGSYHDTNTWDYIDTWLARIGRSSVARCESYTSEFGVRVQFGFKELALKLDTWFGHMATDKHLHPALWTWTKEQRLKFLAGYFDGDGCMITDYAKWPRYYGTLTASTASKSLAMDIQRLLASVGVPSSVSRGHNCEKNGCFGKGDLPIFSISVGSYYSNIILTNTLRLQPHMRTFKQSGASSMQLAHNYALMLVSKVICDNVEDETKYNIEVEEDHTYVVDNQHVMNSNRNGDSFEKISCINYHHTFVKNAHVYRHHRNKDTKKSLGQVVKSAYNEPMGRIELFVHAHKEKARDELEKLARDGEISFSMACRIKEDKCSICGTFRKSASDPNQCEHIRDNLGKTLDDGRVVCTHNPEPQFFDISFVGRPADRIAWNLKTASGEVMDSIKLAEAEGVWVPDHLNIVSASAVNKLALLKKMADFENIYYTVATGIKQASDSASRYLWELRKAAVTHLSEEQLNTLRKYEPSDVFAGLAKYSMVLSPEQFFMYALGPEYTSIKQYMPGIKQASSTIFSNLLDEERCQIVCNESIFDADKNRCIPVELNTHIRGMAKSASFAEVDAQQRVIDATITKVNIKLAFDTNNKLVLTNDSIVNGLAEKYAAYKVSAMQGIFDNTDKDSVTLLGLAVAQNLVL